MASAYARRQRSLSARIAAEAARLWRTIDPQFLDHSWNASIGPRIFAAVSGGQMLAASGADGYLDDALDAQGIDPTAVGSMNPRLLAGVASDGRDLSSLLYEPVIAAKTAIAHGADVSQALIGGLLNLDMIVRTQMADASRAASGIGIVARRHATGYVRMLNPPSCSRCAILAGRWYRWNAGFQRHPRCDCHQIPSSEDVSGDLRTDPNAYFAGLTKADQDRLFTKSGAQAIRDGADLGQVVNARRGAFGLTPAGARITADEAKTLRNGLDRGRLQTRNVFGRQLYTTTEGTTTRGVAGRRLGARESGAKTTGSRYRTAKAPRLMPESIYQIAGNDRDEAIRLLERNGYLQRASRTTVRATAR